MIGLNPRIYSEATVRWGPKPASVRHRDRVREIEPGPAQVGETVVVHCRQCAFQVARNEVDRLLASAARAAASDARTESVEVVRVRLRRVRRRRTRPEQWFLKFAGGVLLGHFALFAMAALISHVPPTPSLQANL